MIVVIGAVEARAAADGVTVTPAGLSADVAMAAAGAGARVEVVTRLGEDAAGDALLLAFAAARIGHVATLRDAAHATALATAVDERLDPAAADDVADAAAAPMATPATATPGRPTLDAADVALALRYLSDYRVIVVVHPAEDGILREVASAADWAGAHLVVLAHPDAPNTPELPAGAVVLAADPRSEGVAGLVGRYAAAVDGGADPASAFRATLGAAG